MAPGLKRRGGGIVDQINHEIEHEKESAKLLLSSLRTVLWDQLPEWQKDNEFIVSGYRRVQNSWRGCVQSVFGYLHNETVNIHSHLWGAVVFLFFLATNEWTRMAKYTTRTSMDTVVFSIFLCAGVFCFSSSALFHTFTCHSKEVSARWHTLDYSGIIVMIVGSFYPAIYYAFYCHSHFQVLYLVGITLAGMGAAYIVLNPKYAQPTHRHARTNVFIALGLSALFPTVHAIWTNGFHSVHEDMGFKWILVSAFLYIQGALIYANRMPERLFPGKFDYFFASHQIFHVHVVLAAVAHYACILTALDHWHGTHSGTCRIP